VSYPFLCTADNSHRKTLSSSWSMCRLIVFSCEFSAVIVSSCPLSFTVISSPFFIPLVFVQLAGRLTTNVFPANCITFLFIFFQAFTVFCEYFGFLLTKIDGGCPLRGVKRVIFYQRELTVKANFTDLIIFSNY